MEGVDKQDRGAETTKLREPTGYDRSGSNSAELRTQVCVRGGDGENISATVCGNLPQLSYLLSR